MVQVLLGNSECIMNGCDILSYSGGWQNTKTIWRGGGIRINYGWAGDNRINIGRAWGYGINCWRAGGNKLHFRRARGY